MKGKYHLPKRVSANESPFGLIPRCLRRKPKHLSITLTLDLLLLYFYNKLFFVVPSAILIYLSTCFPMLLGNIFPRNQSTIVDERKIEYDIRIERSFVNHQVMLNLYSDSIKTDSLTFKNLDLATDRLLNFGNTWWYYIFSENTSCIPTLENKFQIILRPQNKKLSIALFIDYKWTQLKAIDDISLKLDSEALNPSFINIKNQYDLYGQIVLDSNFFNGNYWVSEIIFSYLSYDTMERRGLKKKYELKYDESNNVFYNSIVTINDTCVFRLSEKDLIKRKLNNEKVFMIKFHNKRSPYAYYEGKWYSFFQNSFYSMELFATCPQ